MWITAAEHTMNTQKQQTSVGCNQLPLKGAFWVLAPLKFCSKTVSSSKWKHDNSTLARKHHKNQTISWVHQSQNILHFANQYDLTQVELFLSPTHLAKQYCPPRDVKVRLKAGKLCLKVTTTHNRDESEVRPYCFLQLSERRLELGRGQFLLPGKQWQGETKSSSAPSPSPQRQFSSWRGGTSCVPVCTHCWFSSFISLIFVIIWVLSFSVHYDPADLHFREQQLSHTITEC